MSKANCCPPPKSTDSCCPPPKEEAEACCPPAATDDACCTPESDNDACCSGVLDDQPGFKLWDFVSGWLDSPAGRIPQVATLSATRSRLVGTGIGDMMYLFGGVDTDDPFQTAPTTYEQLVIVERYASTGDCATDADCATGEVCDLNPDAGGVCHVALCVTDDDCAGDLACFDYQCVVDASCETDADCGTGQICSDGFCAADPNYCETNADCGTDERCDANVCTADVACGMA